MEHHFFLRGAVPGGGVLILSLAVAEFEEANLHGSVFADDRKTEAGLDVSCRRQLHTLFVSKR